MAVQGFGNVGSVAARLLAQEGARVVAVSDISGGIYREDGLDMNLVGAMKLDEGGVCGTGAGEPITNAELLELPVDILIPAATERQITAENAPRVRARMVVEAANGPVTPDADRILRDAGTLVVPDILANAGGVIVSYFEWVQDLQAFFWSEAEVNVQLERLLHRAFLETWEAAQKHRTDLRMGAYAVGVSRVADATRTRGIYP